MPHRHQEPTSPVGYVHTLLACVLGALVFVHVAAPRQAQAQGGGVVVTPLPPPFPPSIAAMNDITIKKELIMNGTFFNYKITITNSGPAIP